MAFYETDKYMAMDNYSYAFEDTPPTPVRQLLGVVPPRWGRMPPLSRALVVELGRELDKSGFLELFRPRRQHSPAAGLIGCTGWGSHATDVAFAQSMREDVLFASPALFGYTLPNIPLAEAANHYGLTGPVYALVEPLAPLQSAVREAHRLLESTAGLDMMLACAFDACIGENDSPLLTVNLTLVKKDDHSYHSLS